MTVVPGAVFQGDMGIGAVTVCSSLSQCAWRSWEQVNSTGGTGMAIGIICKQREKEKERERERERVHRTKAVWEYHRPTAKGQLLHFRSLTNAGCYYSITLQILFSLYGNSSFSSTWQINRIIIGEIIHVTSDFTEFVKTKSKSLQYRPYKFTLKTRHLSRTQSSLSNITRDVTAGAIVR